MKKVTLAALVVVHNEEAQLADCLRSVAFVDELVVVLDNCTDNSKQIAEQHQAKILEGHWPIEGERRMLGIDTCTSDWILELDADERVSDALALEIRERLPKATYGYFRIPFDNYVGAGLVKYGWGCSWGINAKRCLFAKGAKHWGLQRVHPKITLKGDAQTVEQSISHYAYKDISDMLSRFNTYTTKRALDLCENPVKQSMRRNIKRIFSRFFKCYVQRKGYKEGYYGVLNGILAGLFPLISYLKYLELKKVSKNT